MIRLIEFLTGLFLFTTFGVVAINIDSYIIRVGLCIFMTIAAILMGDGLENV